MAENIRTRASKGDVDLISGLGDGLEEQGSEQVIIGAHMLRKGERGIGQGQAIGKLDIITRSGSAREFASANAKWYNQLNNQNGRKLMRTFAFGP